MPPISTLPKNIRWRKMNSRIRRLDLNNLKTRKNLKLEQIVRIHIPEMRKLKDFKHKQWLIFWTCLKHFASFKYLK